MRGTGIDQAKIVVTCTRTTIRSNVSSECYLCQNHALAEVRNSICLLYQQLNQGSAFHKAYDVSPSSPPHVRKELAITSYANAYMPCQHPSHVIEDVKATASTIGPNRLKFPGNCRLRNHTQHSTFRSRHVSTSNDAQPHTSLHTCLTDILIPTNHRPRNHTRNCTAQSTLPSMQLEPFLPSLRHARHTYVNIQTSLLLFTSIASTVPVF